MRKKVDQSIWRSLRAAPSERTPRVFCATPCPVAACHSPACLPPIACALTTQRDSPHHGFLSSLYGGSHRPVLGSARDGIVVCCADSMEVRLKLAKQAAWLYGGGALFIETRSLGNDGYVHAFNADSDYVGYYLDTCFPETVAETDCGGAGTVAMGMMMAALVATIVTQWKSSGGTQLPLNEHYIQLGYGHQARPFILEERR